MLSYHKIGSASEAGKYYQSDSNYYSQESGGLEKSEWYGAGAEALGLSGEVDDKTFARLLSGDVGEGIQLGRMVNGERQHTPGWDLTFSAPKSVSIMALSPGGDRRLIAAHDEAVKATLAYIEKELIVTRVQGEDGVDYQATGNMTAALFQHATSRALDPQLHTHSVLQNMTVNDSGEWRSIVSQAFMRTDMKKTLGLFYRGALANNVKDLGYDLNIDHKKGVFEIAGVPAELIKSQSKRRQEIEASAQERGLKGGKEMEKAAIMTRQKKMKVSGATLDEVWKGEQQEHGFNPASLREQVMERSKGGEQQGEGGRDRGAAPEPVRPSDKRLERMVEQARGKLQEVAGAVRDWFASVEQEAHKQPQEQPKEFRATFPPGVSDIQQERAINDVRVATAIFADREAAFTKERLVKQVAHMSLGLYPPQAIEPAVKTLIGNGELVPSLVSTDRKNEAAFTTPEALRKERYILKTMKEGQGTVKPIMAKQEVAEHVADVESRSIAAGFERGLTKGQAEAVELIATSPDRFVAVQGFAGTGKTFMQNEAKTLIERQGYTLKGFAPTGSAVATLQEDTGIPSRTIDSFLFDMENQYQAGKLPDLSKEVWVVDEASLVAANNMASMMTFARRTGARMIMQGDKQQIGSIEWGKPFTLMQQEGIATAKMDEIIRQKNSKLREGVYHTVDGKIQQAIDAIPDMFSEITHKDNDTGRALRIKAAADAYVELPPSERKNTLLVIPDNETRMAVMENVRGQLVERGEVGKEGVSVTALISADMTPAAKRDARFYEKGMVIEFNRAYRKDVQADKGDRMKVVGIDHLNNTLTLEGKGGKLQSWNPKQVAKFGIDTFKEQKITLAERDKVIWRKTNKEIGLTNGDKGEVVSIDPAKNTATIKFERGGEKTINLDHERNLMWNYATTAYSSQGMTVKHVIGIVESFRRNVVNQKSFYVTLSRAEKSVLLFTDSKKTLANEVQKRLADKTSSLESVRALSKNREQKRREREPQHGVNDPTQSPFMREQHERQAQREQQQAQKQQVKQQRVR